MDVVVLSRLQFALATFFHFLFVPLTIGLSFFVAIMETRYVKTGDEGYKAQAKFWGRIFLINFAVGVVTGLTLEFQFGTNWGGYSKYMGDIFGSLLAIEALVAFFLESTLIGVWAFGWKILPKRVHLAAIWLIAIASTVSALWIILANGFMQNPVGYHEVTHIVGNIVGQRAELTNFWTVFFNPYGWAMFFHTVIGGFIVGAFFVLGVSAFNILRKKQVAFFKKSFTLAMIFALTFSVLALLVGHQLGQITAKYQPAKFAAMESHWVTSANAPINVLVWPHPTEDGNIIETVTIPSLLSFLAHGNFKEEVIGLNDIAAENRPPITLTFIAFRSMIALGLLFILLSLWSLWANRKTEKHTVLLFILIFTIPLPYLAMQFGWVVTEVGRQPWIVYGLLRTTDGVSTGVSSLEVASSLGFMAVVYSLITALAVLLIGRIAIQGPKESDGITDQNA